MSLITRFAKRSANGITGSDVWGDGFLGSHSTASGSKVDQHTALRLVAVHFCVSLIADVVATLPLDVYQTKPGKANVREEIPAPTWIDHPNDEMTSVDFWHRVMVSLLLDGNAFIYIWRNPATGLIAKMIPLNPAFTQVYRWNGLIKYVYGGDVNNPLPIDAQILDRENLLHITAFTRPGDLRGLSPIDLAREAVGLGLSMEDYAARFFGQGATLSGAIESPQPMNIDQAKVMARAFADHHAGGRKAHLPLILTNGATWTQISVPNDQAQFLESRRFTKTEIGNLYRVPGYLLDPQVSSTWGSGIEEQNRMLTDITFSPWTVRIERAVSDRLFPSGQYVRFNLDALLRGRTLDRYGAHRIGLEAKFLTVNEVRASEDLPPLPGGDRVQADPKPPAPAIPPGNPPDTQPADNPQGGK